MKTPNIVDIVAISVSGVFALISAVAAIWSVRASRKSNDIQREMLRIEQQRERDKSLQRQRADLVIRLIRRPQHRRSDERHLVELCNQGRAPARNIEVMLNDQSIADIPSVAKGKGAQDTSLWPNDTWTWHIRKDPTFTPPWNAIVKWHDDSGEEGRCQTTLSY